MEVTTDFLSNLRYIATNFGNNHVSVHCQLGLRKDGQLYSNVNR